MFDRRAWAKLRDNTPLTLSERDLRDLRGLNDAMSLAEVEQIYLPLSRLLSLHVRATQELHRASQIFLGDQTAKVPFIIGLAGSVAVGKSTTARILQALLSRWPGHPSVDLVTTDGFLFPNAVLDQPRPDAAEGLSRELRPGPARALPGRRQVGRARGAAPRSTRTSATTSCPAAPQAVRQPDIAIVEGLNVLAGAGQPRRVAGVRLRLLRLHDLRRRRRGRHRALVRGAVPAAARHRLPGPAVVLPPLRVAERSRSAPRPPPPSGPRSTA